MRWRKPAASALAIVGAAVLVGCQTYQVVVAAPESFWITLEEIITALAKDVWSVIDLFL